MTNGTAATAARPTGLWAFAIRDDAAAYDDPLEAAEDRECRAAYPSSAAAMAAAEESSIDRLDGGGEYTRSEWAGPDDKGRFWQTAEGHWGGTEWETTLEVWEIVLAGQTALEAAREESDIADRAELDAEDALEAAREDASRARRDVAKQEDAG